MVITPDEVRVADEQRKERDKKTAEGRRRKDVLHGIEESIDKQLLGGRGYYVTVSIRELYELEGLKRPAARGKRGEIDNDLKKILDRYRAMGWIVEWQGNSDDFFEMKESYSFNFPEKE